MKASNSSTRTAAAQVYVFENLEKKSPGNRPIRCRGVRHRRSSSDLHAAALTSTIRRHSSLHRLLDVPVEARAPRKPLASRPPLSAPPVSQNEPKLSPFSLSRLLETWLGQPWKPPASSSSTRMAAGRESGCGSARAERLGFRGPAPLRGPCSVAHPRGCQGVVSKSQHSQGQSGGV